MAAQQKWRDQLFFCRPPSCITAFLRSKMPRPLFVNDPLVPSLRGCLVTVIANPASVASRLPVPGGEGLAVDRRSATVEAPDRWPRLPAAGGSDEFVVGRVEWGHGKSGNIPANLPECLITVGPLRQAHRSRRDKPVRLSRGGVCTE